MLLTNDIAIYGVNFDSVIANGSTYTTEASLPSGFTVVYSGNVVKLTVTSSVSSSGVNKTPSLTNTGKATFRVYLSSVNQAPGDTDILTVYYTEWAQATASATSNINSSATGKGFTKEQNRKAVVTVTGEDGGDSKSDPTTAISNVRKQVYYNVHWYNSGTGTV